MNTSDWEQQLKSLLETKEYSPSETEWGRMQQSLQAGKRHSLWLALPLRRAAAAALLLLGTSIAWYLFRHREPQQAPAVATKAIPAMPVARYTPVGAQEHQTTGTSGNYTSHQAMATATRPAGIPITVKKEEMPAPLIPEAAREEHIAQTDSTTIIKTATDNGLARHKKQPAILPEKIYAGVESYKTKTPGLQLGLAANVGKPSQGNVQYKAGLVLRKELTRILFAETGLSFSSTQVTYSERTYIPSLGTAESAQMNTPLDLSYRGNMYAIGIAPAIGVRATRNLSLTLGGDVYKSLNRDLLLQDNPATATGTQLGIVLPERSITSWDAGIRGQLEYKVSRKLSLNTQYRQGLTQYILVNGKTFRNSIFNIGFRYDLGQ